MNENHTDIEFLITAFSYSYSLLNETFYLRKKDFKIVGVHVMDYALISECKSEYDSGLTADEERDIKEAIIASEKNYDTHIIIPRLTKTERLDIIKEFLNCADKYRKHLKKNYKDLINSSKKYRIKYYKKNIKPGIELEYLTNGIDDDEFKNDWTRFYRDKVKIMALDWLNTQKND